METVEDKKGFPSESRSVINGKSFPLSGQVLRVVKGRNDKNVKFPTLFPLENYV